MVLRTLRIGLIVAAIVTLAMFVLAFYAHARRIEAEGLALTTPRVVVQWTK